MKWELKTLDELGFVGRGKSKHRPRGDEKLYGGNYKFIQTGDIAGSEFYITSFSRTYSDFGLAQSKLWKKGT
ncbi:MAG: restriction endonuclease subunit S, partial [Saprospiraceae bacterium]